MKNVDYVNVHSVNLLYLIVGETDGYIEAKTEKYLIFVSTDKNKEVLTKYTER